MKYLCLEYLYFILCLLNFTSIPISALNFCKNESMKCQDRIELYAGRMLSSKSLLTYRRDEFGLCDLPEKDFIYEGWNQDLYGEKLLPFQINFMKNKSCETVCKSKFNKTRLQILKEGIELNYENYWFVDQMPVSSHLFEIDGEQIFTTGFPMGCLVEDGPTSAGCAAYMGRWDMKNKFVLFNHLHIRVEYSTLKGQIGAKLLRVIVKPQSFQFNCSGQAVIFTKDSKEELSITFTYSVEFVENNHDSLSPRTDYLIRSSDNSKIKHFSLINSSIVIFAFSVFLGIILYRNVKIRTIPLLEKTTEKENESIEKLSGWRSLHGDVFRPPCRPMLLSALVGVGIQISLIVVFMLLLGYFGYFCIDCSGNLEMSLTVLFVLSSFVAGYTSARLYKSMHGYYWTLNILLVSLVFPSFIFGLILVLNFIHWGSDSASVYPPSFLLKFVAVWFCGAFPANSIGGCVGRRQKVINHPTVTENTPRVIPKQPVFTRTIFCFLIGGILPFSCLFLPQFFAMTAVWVGGYFTSYGFTLFSTVAMVAVTLEATTLFCYLHLAAQDYRWWWRSFITPGSVAVWVYAYAVKFYFSNTELLGTVSAVLYLGYNLVVVVALFLSCGSIGFTFCYFFIRTIYSRIKFESFLLTSNT